MGASERRKGRRAENEAAALLGGAERISEAGSSGPDLRWRGRFVEVRRRESFQSMNQIVGELDGDASLYMTRTNRGDWYGVLRIVDLLDLLDEAFEEGHAAGFDDGLENA